MWEAGICEFVGYLSVLTLSCVVKPSYTSQEFEPIFSAGIWFHSMFSTGGKE